MKKMLLGVSLLVSMSSFASSDLTDLVCVGQNTIVKFTSNDHSQYQNEAITHYGDGNKIWTSFINPILEDTVDNASGVRTLRRESIEQGDLFKLTFNEKTGKGEISVRSIRTEYKEDVRCVDRLELSESYK